MKRFWISLLYAGYCLSAPSFADEQYKQCLLTQMATAGDTVTVGELRQYCQQVSTEAPTEPAKAQIAVSEQGIATTDNSAITRRLFLEEKEARNPFALIPHKPNYIMLSNNMASPNEEPFNLANPNDPVHFQPWETKFQISLKLQLARGLINHNGDLFVAYTNRSFWQQFNKEGSSPFRESDHEPEAWLSFKNDTEFLGIKNSVIRTGIVHQSNGQSGSLSRSWNRVYADFIFEYQNWYFSLKPWWRIPESAKNDDNPDIEHYMGNFEFGALYQAGEHNFDLMLRNNFNFGDNVGAVQLGWSFPINKRVRGYLQWFNGYGESLIDYNARSNSVGLGIQLSDWL